MKLNNTKKLINELNHMRKLNNFSINEGQESHILDTLKDDGIDAYFRDGVLYVSSQSDANRAKTRLSNSSEIRNKPEIRVESRYYEKDSIEEVGPARRHRQETGS